MNMPANSQNQKFTDPREEPIARTGIIGHLCSCPFMPVATSPIPVCDLAADVQTRKRPATPCPHEA